MAGPHYEVEYLEDYLDDDNAVDSVDIITQSIESKSAKTLTKKNQKSKKSEFNSVEKRKLCALVKSNPCIWKLEDKLHKICHAVAGAWSQIAKEMEKQLEECKSVRKSLKDSRRYHKLKARKPSKSGNPAPDYDMDTDEEDLFFNVDEMNNWEFEGDISSASSDSRRRTFPTSTRNEDSQQHESGIEDSNASNYSYMGKRNSKAAVALSSAESLTNSLNELAKMPSTSRDSVRYQQKHEVILNNLDRMLQKLPDDVVEELNFKFQE